MIASRLGDVRVSDERRKTGLNPVKREANGRGKRWLTAGSTAAATSQTGLASRKAGFVARQCGQGDCVDNRERIMEIAALLDLHTTSTTALVFPGRRRAGHAAPAARAFGFSTAIAFGMSLQYLAQMFVWRNWPISEVLQGWLYIFRDRLIVATLITLPIVALGILRTHSPLLRSALLAAGVLGGAIAGEWFVRLLYDQQNALVPLITSALRWGAVAFAVASTYYLWRASADSGEQLRQESLRRQSVEQQLTNTRLTALRKQIEPHFLFNTLATVRRLHQTDPVAGAGMLAGFIDYLRRVLPMLECSEVPLGDEINLIRAYLTVIQLRMLGRLAVTFDVPNALRTAQVPPLALATLVENAIKHGLAPLPAGGTISITASSQQDVLELVVADNGVGLRADSGGGTGIGLYNVRARLATLYGAKAALQVQANRPTGVYATIRLPLRETVG
jgi:signal transduction histidine kinase